MINQVFSLFKTYSIWHPTSTKKASSSKESRKSLRKPLSLNLRVIRTVQVKCPIGPHLWSDRGQPEQAPRGLQADGRRETTHKEATEVNKAHRQKQRQVAGHWAKDCRVGNPFIEQPNRSGFPYSSSATPTKPGSGGFNDGASKYCGYDTPFHEFTEAINDYQRESLTGSAILQVKGSLRRNISFWHDIGAPELFYRSFKMAIVFLSRQFTLGTFSKTICLLCII